MEIVRVEAPNEITIEQVNIVKEAFRPNFDAMVPLQERYKALTGMKLAEPTKEQCEEARKVRLALVKTRTGTRDVHKDLKSDALVYGRYLDGMKRAQLTVCEKWEADLREIEEHFERIENDRIEALAVERMGVLVAYEVAEAAMPADLGEMHQSVWNSYSSSVRDSYYQRKADEKKAEEDRIAKEKAEAEERERVRLENEKLKAELAEKEEANRKELERLENIRIQQEEKLKAEQAERERLEARNAEREKKEMAELQAEEKRVSDVKHRLNIEEDIKCHIGNFADSVATDRIMTAIKAGVIPHLVINY